VITHARRAVPWAAVATGGGVSIALMLVVAQWPYAMWPLEGCAVGLLGATAAWCFDEPSAAVVDTAPRGLAWRTAARSAGLVLLALSWAAAVALTHAELFGHPLDVGWQGLAAMVAVTAFATWRRSRGVATPARSVVATVVPVAAFAALARPLEHQLPLFPYTEAGEWAASRALWAAIAVVGLGLLASHVAERTVGTLRPQTTR
jgi:hypothetical protein